MNSPYRPPSSKTHSGFNKSCHLLKCPRSDSLQIPTHFSTAKHKEGSVWGGGVKLCLAYSCMSLFLG